jgi:starch synthase (maltosyl-transferring)
MPDLLERDPPVIRGDAGPRVSRPVPGAIRVDGLGGPAIYQLPRRMLGDAAGWPERIAAGAAMGFNAVLLGTPFAGTGIGADFLVRDYDNFDAAFGGGAAIDGLRAAAGAAAAAGVALFLDVALDHVAVGAPLLEEHADWFVHWVENGAEHDREGASFRYLGETDATVDWWDDRLAAWQAAGVGGFVCPGVAAVPAAVWERLIAAAKARDPGVVFVAWTAGLADAAIAGLRGTGFDFSFSSSCWWDFAGGWLNADAARTEALAPMIAIAAPPGVTGWSALQKQRALRFSAMYAAGWMVAAGLAEGSEDELAALNALRRAQKTLETAPAALLVSSSGADIAVLRRGDLVVAVNASLARAVACGADVVMPAAQVAGLVPLAGGTALGPADVLNLQAGAVVLFQARALAPVFLPVAVPLNLANARIGIEAITPQVDDGRFPVRRVVGELVKVQADLIADGHDKLAGALQFRAADEREFRTVPLRLLNNDRWEAAFPLERVGRHEFMVVAWKDVFATFVDEVTKKHAAGVPVALELREGEALVLAAAQAAKAALRARLDALLDLLKNQDEDGRRMALLSVETAALMREADVRAFATSSHPVIVDAERLAAGFASWYEMFPRSQAGDGVTHGTFRDVIKQLPRVAAMGFDVLYFTPIHPIGRSNRKGKNNTLTPGPDDPGSPYAIGSSEGGHDAVHPELGTLADFHALHDAAADLGIELALDFAIQCAPDHPWLKEHPEWFDWRPDGSLRYAENPPKKYEDIVNVDFYAAGAQPSLWIALRDVVQFWVDQGVRLFRVDNPHTKPLPFWEWMIADIKSRHPDVVFLAEAFTRPKVMYRLAKIGFGQSYTYFTWRNTKAELEAYLTELTTTAPRDFFRPHFFVNTPDINPEFLQTSGRGGFLIRAALAATLSGLWGVYNGFELCEATPVPGKEDYLNSEKYEIKAWDYDRPGNIVPEISKLNRIRRGNAALHTHLNVTFLLAYSDQAIYFMKTAADGNHVLVAISLDPVNAQDVTIELPLWRLGVADDGALEAEDLMRDYKFTWRGKYQNVRLDPVGQPFCIWRISAPAA